jgi:hypothetical protein
MDFIYYLLTITLSFLGGYLGAYFNQRGKNAAILDDIEKLTKKVENIKAEIQSSINEHQIKFTKLHELKINAIIDLYKELNKIHKEIELKLYELSIPKLPNRIKLYIDTTKIIDDLRNKFKDIDIFFDDNLIYIFNKIMNDYFDIIMKVKTSSEKQAIFTNENTYQYKLSNISVEEMDKTFLDINNAWNAFRDDIPKLKSQIREEIKKELKVKIIKY